MTITFHGLIPKTYAYPPPSVRRGVAATAAARCSSSAATARTEDGKHHRVLPVPSHAGARMRGPVLSLSADRSTANQAIFRNPPVGTGFDAVCGYCTGVGPAWSQDRSNETSPEPARSTPHWGYPSGLLIRPRSALLRRRFRPPRPDRPHSRDGTLQRGHTQRPCWSANTSPVRAGSPRDGRPKCRIKPAVVALPLPPAHGHLYHEPAPDCAAGVRERVPLSRHPPPLSWTGSDRT